MNHPRKECPAMNFLENEYLLLITGLSPMQTIQGLCSSDDPYPKDFANSCKENQMGLGRCAHCLQKEC